MNKENPGYNLCHNEVKQMKCYDEIYTKLKNDINCAESRFILLKRLLSIIEGTDYDMPGFLQSSEGQAVFYNVIMELVSEQLISPVGKKPDTQNGLYLKYRINRDIKKKDSELAAQIIRSIVLPATIDYYIKYPYDFLNDRVIIDVISNFLKRKNKDFLTVNERAYQLFGDEKFFKGDEKNRSRGEIVLKRLGLGYLNIGCEETVEPFFSFYKKDFHSRTSRYIYIIENKDTFWSFKKNIMDATSILKSDMLIYGEGKKIISSFRFVDEYEIDKETDLVLYFGDLDPEGINIYCELQDKYPQYKIAPFSEGYLAILENGLKRGISKTPKPQNISKENIARFIKEFAEPYVIGLNEVLDGGFYIPQEALTATEMKERFGNT